MLVHAIIVDKSVRDYKTNLSNGRDSTNWTYVSMISGHDSHMTNPSAKARQVLAANLARLMDDPDTPFKTDKLVAAETKRLGRTVSYKLVERYRKMLNDPSLEAVEAIAKVFKLEPWQILIPDLHPDERPEIRRRIAVEV